MKSDVIVSISTPIGKGAVAIVRMSGEGAFEIALKIFHSKKLESDKIVPRYMYFGQLELEKNVFEQCLFVFFKAPFSYTGEDIVEFQVHGGVLLAQKVLERCLYAGARLAEPGEYSKRAFLNGKISLDKAEAIALEIDAESEGELKSSLSVCGGKLAEVIEEQQKKLTNLLAELEVGMDYPDETEELGLKTNARAVLDAIEKNLGKIISDSKSATYLKNGIFVTLVGKTNVGKSSVMNALLGQNRAIVTDIQGTTRDALQESFMHRGVKVNIIDTAGIRETSDTVERFGIEKSKEALRRADVVLFVLDGSEKEGDDDREIERLIPKDKCVYVINKSDKKRILEKKSNEIEISALKGKNVGLLKDKIVDFVIENEIDFSSLVLTNERQLQILKEAKSQIEESMDLGLPLDVLAFYVKKVWTTLGKITGKTENEDIIDLIFSKFCLGK